MILMPKTIWIINQYSSTPETGYGGRHYYLAKGLESMGHNVYVVAASYTHLLRRAPKVSAGFTLEMNEGIKQVWVKMPRYGQAHSKKRIWNWFLFGWKLCWLDRHITERPDIILYSSPSLIGYLGAEYLARRLRSKLLFEVRDIWPLTLCEIGEFSEKHPFICFLQWVENRAYRNADIIISNLKNAYQHMQQHGMDGNKFYWIPNGISLEEVGQPQPLLQDVADRLPKTGFTVGYVGTLGVANCLDTLLEAAGRLRERDDINFVLVGHGKEALRLQQLARRSGLRNVLFTGAIPKQQVQTILARFDVLFIGLTKEPLFRFGVSPNKLFDYLYAGKPIIYAIESGDYHPVRDAGAGVEIPAEDPAALADAVMMLYETVANKRAEMGENGRKAVTEHYDYRVLAKQFCSII